MSNTVLIFGASGFIGNVIYKELLPYYDVYGTYCAQKDRFKDNQVFFEYDVATDNSFDVLEAVQPNIIISAIGGDYKSQYKAHQEWTSYAMTNNCRLFFLSSFAVFDGYSKFPAYETTVPKSESPYGNYQLSIERMLLGIPEEKYAILRLPMVLGVTAPLIQELKLAIKNKSVFDVFPNHVISATLVDKVAQQIHYIINQALSGIFHLSSNDVMHHEEIFKEISEKISSKTPIFKQVYERNEDRYFAILPKENLLPKTYQITMEEVIEACTLNEEIQTFKE